MADKKSSGCVVSKSFGFIFFIFFASSLIAVGLLVYFFADRPSIVSPRTTDDTVIAKSDYLKKPLNFNRLPKALIPYHYDIRLLPILEKGNFSILGQVSIEFECRTETDRIVLHSLEIVIDPKSVRLSGRNNGTFKVNSVEYDTELEFAIVRLNQNLSKGFNYTLSMEFVGQLNDKLKGFYRSSYRENGVEKFLAVTQFEATDARRAFPCFDEPNMKATFSVTLGRHKSMISLSNMPLMNTTTIDGMDDFFWDHFEKSVVMPTYLVAFVVADFKQVKAELSTDSKWSFNIYARPSAENQTRYAREVGPKIQTYFEDYFQIPYPLPKQDMIAIPDFGPGAMENWGLITYRETLLLNDEKTSSAASKARVLLVIAHELAHQWFGNLVTMDWWSDLWLNEGFANYFETLAANFVDPSFQFPQNVLIEDYQTVMKLDSLETSRPVSLPVNYEEELFDGYPMKGGCLLRMMNNFLGEETFRQGIINYLNSRRYSNAVQDDVWEVVGQQAKKDQLKLPATVKQIMDTWTLKKGFPVVFIQRDYQNNTNRVTIKQERFLMQSSNSSQVNSETVYLWWIPLTYTTDFNKTGLTWMADNQTSLTVSLDLSITKDQWLIFNMDQIGYYRVNYDQRNWELIAEQLIRDHSVISIMSRSHLMNDALNLAQAGSLDYEIVFNLTRYLAQEREYLPWESTLSSLGYISEMMSRTSDYGFLKKHFKKIITPAYDALGFFPKINDTYYDIKLRIILIDWACSSRVANKDCILNAKESYAQWMANPENQEIVSPDLKKSIVCTAVREGGEEEWDFAFDRYVKSSDASEKDTLLSCLSCSEQPWILSRLLQMSLNSSSSIRKQDATGVMIRISGNPLGRYLIFNLVRNRWNEIKETLPTAKHLGRIIIAMARSFNTPLELKELTETIREHLEEMPEAALLLQQAIDVAQTNLNWMRKNYPNVSGWLANNY